mmetsp:Transcript_8883/g.23196  ORF Transcript_8883/g.23196 Transcript_8883/m.23196 type:complete len:223 (+) Transcript_8883:228-896(+)
MQDKAIRHHLEKHFDQKDEGEDHVEDGKVGDNVSDSAAGGYHIQVGAVTGLEDLAPVVIGGTARALGEGELPRLEAAAVEPHGGLGTCRRSYGPVWLLDGKCDGSEDDANQDGVVEERVLRDGGNGNAHTVVPREEEEGLVVGDLDVSAKRLIKDLEVSLVLLVLTLPRRHVSRHHTQLLGPRCLGRLLGVGAAVGAVVLDPRCCAPLPEQDLEPPPDSLEV